MGCHRECVNSITNKNFRKYYYDINPNKLKRSFKSYHLDHIYSVVDGFNNKIPSNIIANPNNLQMLWCKDNMSKHGDSHITKDELYRGYNKFLTNGSS